MSRKPLPDREVILCARLRLWRENLQLTRPMIASEIGLTAESYANYELARAPLRYGLVYKLTSRFTLNPGWLATGEGPQDIQILLPSAHDLGVSPRDLFTAVFNQDLAALVTEQVNRFFERPLTFLRTLKFPRQLPINGRIRAQVEKVLISQLQDWVLRLPDSELVDFTNRVLEFADELFAKTVFDTYPEYAEVVEERRREVESARRVLNVKVVPPPKV